MYQTKEQLMSDIALLIKAHDQKEFQNKLIRQEEQEIKHLTLKQVKKEKHVNIIITESCDDTHIIVYLSLN